MPYFVLDVSNF